jgi:octaprenyl-diphosphate synthase
MMQLSEIRTLLQAELQATDALISRRESMQVDIVNLLKNHVSGAGGKRLRPMVLLLIAKAFNYPGQDHITMAAATELVHTASLLHDDVVDQSTLRRGQKTANEIWGNATSVLVGDFLYSRAFELTVSVDNSAITRALARTTHLVARGEIMQLGHKRNFAMTTQDYLDIISHKTGKLFEAAAQMGVLLIAPQHEEAANTYGLNLGIAFQIMDDLLDYQGTVQEIGKNVGDDLADGKLTLPLLYLLKSGNNAYIELVQSAFETGDITQVIPLQQAIIQSGALEYTQNLAQEYALRAQQALTVFPENVYTKALKAITTFAIKRDH